jgi:hypothetical protein
LTLPTTSLIKDIGMLHTTFFPNFLIAYNAVLGSWEYMELGTPVSPHSVEAMNLILQKGGILAFIGTREEFSRFLESSSSRHGKATSRSWISPELDTILGILGLYLISDEAGRSEVIFYGSPLTWTLTVMLCCQSMPTWQKIVDESPESFFLGGVEDMATGRTSLMVIPSRDTVYGFPLFNHGRIYITECDVQLARSYLMPQTMAKHVPGSEYHEDPARLFHVVPEAGTPISTPAA